MKPIHILIIDDQYARDDLLRMDLLTKTGIVEMIIGQSVSGDIGAVFCSGQNKQGNELRNDYAVIAKTVEQGWGDDADFEWDLVLLDVQFDSGELVNGKPEGKPEDNTFGVSVREWLRQDFPDLPVVMFSGKHEYEIKDSQEHYLSKEGINERELKRVLLIYGKLSLEQARHLLGLGPKIIFASRKMLMVYCDAYLYAVSKEPILILGESGTGKEVLAKYIHRMSPRKDNPFIPVNMATIPKDTAESELFGHEKGSFTGAVNSKKGYFELADNGTLFLDEIGDLDLSLQPKLFRTVQFGEISKIGAQKKVTVDVRLISATNFNIEERIAANAFREELFQRINLATIKIPPLRDRRDDIMPLAKAVLKEAMEKGSKTGIKFSEDSMNKLKEYDFPGNVRELENMIRKLVLKTGNNRLISKADIISLLPETPNGTANTIGQDGASSALQLPATAAQGNAEINYPPSSMQPPSQPNVTLANLHEVIAAIDIKSDDTALRGIKPRVESAIQILMQRCVGAALELCKKPMTGKYELLPAMKFLFADDSMKSTPALREFEKIMYTTKKELDEAVLKNEGEKAFDIWVKTKRDSK